MCGQGARGLLCTMPRSAKGGPRADAETTANAPTARPLDFHCDLGLGAPVAVGVKVILIPPCIFLRDALYKIYWAASE